MHLCTNDLIIWQHVPPGAKGIKNCVSYIQIISAIVKFLAIPTPVLFAQRLFSRAFPH